MPAAARACVERIVSVVQTACGHRVVSTYVHGSLALGGFDSRRSDVDVLIVVDDAATRLSSQPRPTDGTARS